MSHNLKCAPRTSVWIFAAALLSGALLASAPAATARTSVSPARAQAIRICTAQARSQAPGTKRMRRRELLYASCMRSKGQRP
jgi:hypothetical protein